MTSKTILIAALTLLLAGTCYGAQLNNTWNGAEGNLLITDSSPSAGPENLKICIIAATQPVRKENTSLVSSFCMEG